MKNNLLPRLTSRLVCAFAILITGCSSSSDPESTDRTLAITAGVGSRFVYESIDSEGNLDTGRITLADNHASYGGESNSILQVEDESEKVVWAFKYLPNGDVKTSRLFDAPARDWWTLATTSTKPVTTTFKDTLNPTPPVRHRVTNYTSQFKSKETVTIGGNSYEGRRIAVNASEQDFEGQAQLDVSFFSGEIVFVPALGTYAEFSFATTENGKEESFVMKLIDATLK
jgi:hypothetical protein